MGRTRCVRFLSDGILALTQKKGKEKMSKEERAEKKRLKEERRQAKEEKRQARAEKKQAKAEKRLEQAAESINVSVARLSVLSAAPVHTSGATCGTGSSHVINAHVSASAVRVF